MKKQNAIKFFDDLIKDYESKILTDEYLKTIYDTKISDFKLAKEILENVYCD